jgi:class 3 adenylate cyclase
MAEITKYFRYIFLDVEKYTERSIEAQSDVVNYLNKIVKESVEQNGLKENDLLYIPTGDGLCLAINRESKFDIHMLIALDILQRILNHNNEQVDNMRMFNVRIGINENTDNVIKDINGKTNVAGSGINYASRIMDCADGGQILVSQAVCDALNARELYMNSFIKHTATIKHDINIPLYQYVKQGHAGLNINMPSIF